MTPPWHTTATRSPACWATIASMVATTPARNSLALLLGLGRQPLVDEPLPGLLVGAELLDGDVEVEVGVELLEPGVEGDLVTGGRGERLRRLVGPVHRAGVDGVDRVAGPPVGQELGLLLALGRKRRVGRGVASVDPKGQSVSDQPELHGADVEGAVPRVGT